MATDRRDRALGLQGAGGSPASLSPLAVGGHPGRRHLLALAGLDRTELQRLLDLALHFDAVARRRVKRVPTLQGRTVVNLFVDDCPRARSAFELAAKRLSADTVSLVGSAAEHESLLDTARAVGAWQPDVVVLRHAHAGAAHLLARAMDAGIINAGDGAHEDPTQALADCLAITTHRGPVEGLKIVLLGDVAHSAVARSALAALGTLGAELVACAPPTLLPPGLEAWGCATTSIREEALTDAHVVLVLPTRLDRPGTPLVPGPREYARFFGLDRRALGVARPDCLVLHPGPIQRGVEIEPEVADGPQAHLVDQVRLGVAARMAALYHCAGGAGDD